MTMTASSPGPLVRLTGLEQRLGDPRAPAFTVRIDELEVHAGEWIALIGPTGCGKTTTLQVLGLGSRPQQVREFLLRESGAPGAPHDLRRLWQEGRQARIESLRRRVLGFALQRPELIPSFTVEENVGIPLRLNGVQGAAERVSELLTVLSCPDHGKPDLLDRRRRRPSALSGGQAQRVGLARAVAHRPALLLADEPTNNLDERTIDRVFSFLDALRAQGTAIVMVTHDPAAIRRADRILRMAACDDVGRLVRDGPPAVVVNGAEEDFGADLLDAHTDPIP